ncbi:hypothetical protein [Geodermatophilus sp. SYSU D01036]
MSRAKDVRERWIAEVLRTEAVNNSCKVVLFAMYRHMTEAGRVSYPRERLAAEVGFKNPQRVTDRIKEAKDAGLIDVVHSGYRGMTATYEAMLPRPKAPRSGVATEPKGNGSRGPIFGVAFPAADSGAEVGKEPPDRVANARATSRTHGNRPAPNDRRVLGDYDKTSQAAVGASWLPTPPKRPSSDSTGRVA